MKKSTIAEVELILWEMHRARAEHPKATISYAWEDKEVRISYPLPPDYGAFTKRAGRIFDL